MEESDESEANRIFLLFERGQCGHLDLKQFKQALAELDLTNKAKVLHRYTYMRSAKSYFKVEKLFHKIDLDGNGSVDFEEFLMIFKFKQYLEKEEEETESASTKKMFDMFDKDQTGYLSVEEWLQV